MLSLGFFFLFLKEEMVFFSFSKRRELVLFCEPRSFLSSWLPSEEGGREASLLSLPARQHHRRHY